MNLMLVPIILPLLQERTGPLSQFRCVSALAISDPTDSHASYRNHPVIKEDGLLAIFLTEPSFESWRKHSSISYEEESVSKRVDRVEEMSIPSDLEDKLALVIPAHLTQNQLDPWLFTDSYVASSVCSSSSGRRSAFLPSA